MTEFANEGDRASDQTLTGIVLGEARLVVAAACELDVESVQDSSVLARRLRGVSQAVTDIIVAGRKLAAVGVDTAAQPGSTMPTVFAVRSIRHYENPETQTGRTFVAHPSKSRGARMAVQHVQHINNQETLRPAYDLRLPTDAHIDRLLGEEPCLWDETSPHALDFRNGFDEIYPFSTLSYTEGAPQRYYGMFKELATELLALSQ